jgi:single-strand DNA-binding protein
MADLNKVFLMGRLTFDPELRRTPSGTAVTELRLATTRSWSGRDGERREETLFVDVTVWDRQAENCCQFLKKGRSVHVEGSLRMDTWEDKNTGEKRSKVRVQADRVQFLDSRSGESVPAGSPDDDFAAAAPAREPAARRSGGYTGRPAGGGQADVRSSAANGPSHAAPAAAHQPPADHTDLEDEDIPPF